MMLAGLNQPLAILCIPWEQIHIDFVVELAEDARYSIIMTCVDHFSKMVVLVPLYESDAYTIANHFLAEIVSHHRLLLAIVSKKDPRFYGNFWEDLKN